MLYHLLYPLRSEHIIFNVFGYITFRAIMATLIAMMIAFALGPWLIRKLKDRQISQQIREDGPSSHLSKKGTPTMGGLLVLVAIIGPALLFCRYDNAYFWLVLLLTFVIGYDVALRYIFNAPTKWAYEMSYQLGGTYFWLGAAYTLKYQAHVRIDIFYSRFSPRVQALVDVILYLVLFFPVWGGLTYYLVPYIIHSWQIREKAMMGFWQPIIYPFKTGMIIGTVLLLIQGAAEFIRCCVILLAGKKGT